MAAEFRQAATPYFANAPDPRSRRSCGGPTISPSCNVWTATCPKRLPSLRGHTRFNPITSRRSCGWRDRHRSREWTGAEELLNRALTLQPESAAALYWLGRAALARRISGRLSIASNAASRRQPGRSKFQYQLALAYRGLGETAKAESMAREAGCVMSSRMIP
jgi:hypothetical protein